MLVLHGGGGPVLGYPFADRLADRFELIEPVDAGFAGMPIPDHFDGLEDLVYLYLDLMDAFELEQTIVLGNSLGGWLAAEIAVRTTARIAKLIMVDLSRFRESGVEPRVKVTFLDRHGIAARLSSRGNERVTMPTVG